MGIIFIDDRDILARDRAPHGAGFDQLVLLGGISDRQAHFRRPVGIKRRDAPDIAEKPHHLGIERFAAAPDAAHGLAVAGDLPQ